MNVFLLPMVRSSWADTPKSTGRGDGGRVSRGYSRRAQSCTKLNVCIISEQHILPLDVPMDDLALVQVTETLRGGWGQRLASIRIANSFFTHSENLATDVGNPVLLQ